jgi:quercetin dioxygenase-like cupin family protein
LGTKGLRLYKDATSSEEVVKYLAAEGELPGAMFGTGCFAPGSRHPAKGFSQHMGVMEISYVVSGESVFHTEKEVIRLGKGDVLYNPSGTKHFVENKDKKPCVVFWVLAKESKD